MVVWNEYMKQTFQVKLKVVIRGRADQEKCVIEGQPRQALCVVAPVGPVPASRVATGLRGRQ
jgi:hypothetical protein